MGWATHIRCLITYLTKVSVISIRKKRGKRLFVKYNSTNFTNRFIQKKFKTNNIVFHFCNFIKTFISWNFRLIYWCFCLISFLRQQNFLKFIFPWRLILTFGTFNWFFERKKLLFQVRKLNSLCGSSMFLQQMSKLFVS